jgi:hypothetical protein
MTDQTYRRTFGAAFGAALGLAFGVMSQATNPLAVPGVTFHQPPLGMWGNIVGAVLACGLIGFLVAWWDSAFISILIAALVVGLGIELVGTLYGTQVPPDGIGPLILTIAVLWLPMTGLLGALFIVLRWIVNKQVEQRRDRASVLRRLLLPGLALIVVGGIGATAMYPAEGQQRIQEMNVLLQAGLESADAASVPPAFAKFAATFKQRATTGYTLQWIKSNLIDWRIGQPAEYQEWQLSIAAARFDNGWVVACLFAPSEAPPNCLAYDRDPTLPALNAP